MIVAITGSTGLVGQHLSRQVRTERNHLVLEVMRVAKGTDTIGAGNIGLHTDWKPLLVKHPDVVVHLAAVIDETLGASPSRFLRINVDGTINLAKQCAAAGVKRFLFVSTVKVLGEASDVVRQASDPARPDGAYAESKWLAEQGLREIAQETNMEVVVIRPPLVYGPGVKGNFFNMLRAVDRGLPLPLGCVRNSRSLVYVGNLVSAIQACLVHPAAAGKTYLVSDADDVSTPELLRRVGAALNKPARLLPVPQWLLRMGGAVLGKQAAVQRLLGSLVVDSAPIQRELGWKPPYTMQQGLRETAMWYRKLKGSS